MHGWAMSLGLGTGISDQRQACDRSLSCLVGTKSDIQQLVVLARLLATGSQSMPDGRNGQGLWDH